MIRREPNPATYLAAVLATEPDANPTNYRDYAAAIDAESLVRLGNPRGDLVDLQTFDGCDPLNTSDFDGSALAAFVQDVQDHGRAA